MNFSLRYPNVTFPSSLTPPPHIHIGNDTSSLRRFFIRFFVRLYEYASYFLLSLFISIQCQHHENVSRRSHITTVNVKALAILNNWKVFISQAENACKKKKFWQKARPTRNINETEQKSWNGSNWNVWRFFSMIVMMMTMTMTMLLHWVYSWVMPLLRKKSRS